MVDTIYVFLINFETKCLGLHTFLVLFVFKKFGNQGTCWLGERGDMRVAAPLRCSSKQNAASLLPSECHPVAIKIMVNQIEIPESQHYFDEPIGTGRLRFDVWDRN
mmetsp:Transcript_62837/g.86376  ORF Transcript_62837/g.86376 Transcript_62837/m.86376 type:complete len:106 (-) Transcript_62837:298-615(-)